MKLLQDNVLQAFHPDTLDGASCWVDVGSRDHAARSDTNPDKDEPAEPYSILWKSSCHHRLHEQLADLAPESPLSQCHFRSFLLRDVGTYLDPQSCTLGLIRAKAYNCNKELFSVTFSDYRTFGSRELPLLALCDTLINDLETASRKSRSVSSARVARASLLRAWDASKRHVRAMSESQLLANYGARREITLRLDALLFMRDHGFFDPCRNPHTGQCTWEVPLSPTGDAHFPFWAIHTRDMNELVFAQAARLVLPLEHLFQTASLSQQVDTEDCIRQSLAFYTAQLFCRLLI